MIQGAKSSFLTFPDEIDQTKVKFKEIFESAIPVQGTRKFHKFVPKDSNHIKAFHISSDSTGELKCVTGTSNILNDIIEIKVGSYVVCMYNGQKYIGFVESYNEEFDDFLINFLTPKGPSSFYAFPDKEDSCNIIKEDIIGMLACPELKAGTSRVQYKFINKEITKLMN